MLVCAYYCAFGTRDRGCQSAPGFPCALCLEGEDKEFAKLGQIMPRDRGRILSPHVVPANAGTHTPRRKLLENTGRRLCFNNYGRWLWVPAFAGTTERAGTTCFVTPSSKPELRLRRNEFALPHRASKFFTPAPPRGKTPLRSACRNAGRA